MIRRDSNDSKPSWDSLSLYGRFGNIALVKRLWTLSILFTYTFKYGFQISYITYIKFALVCHTVLLTYATSYPLPSHASGKAQNGMEAWWRNGWDIGPIIERAWVQLPVGSLSSGYYLGDCLRTGKPSWYITNTKINSAFHPSGAGKLSLPGWG